MPDLPGSLSRYGGAVEESLRAALVESQPPALYQMMRYHLGWQDEHGRPSSAPGKGLRPSLCLWACEAASGKQSQALPAATALELVHQFSLIHDDIQDGDTERRHRPTVWYLWGEGQAINAGDAMLTIAHQTLLGLTKAGVPAEKILQASAILNDGILRMIQGQCLDLSFEDSLEIGVDAYFDMISRKTAALFRCSLYLGTLIASDNESAWKAMGHGGEALGLGFQVVDDILGVWGMEDLTGKRATDIRRRKKSLPVVYALEKSSGHARQELLNIYSKQSLDETDVNIVLAVLDDLDTKEYCHSVAKELCQRAVAEIKAAEISTRARVEIEEIVDFLLDREY